MGVQSLLKWGASGVSKKTYAVAIQDQAEEARRPLLTLPSQQSFGPVPSLQDYGATVSEQRSPEARRESLLGRVDEETGVEDDGNLSDETEWDLEERGYYGGSYKRTVGLYTIVPAVSLLTFVLLIFLPVLIWPTAYPSAAPYPRYFPSPLPELLVSGALWALTHLLRLPFYTLVTALIPWPLPGTLAFHVLYVTTNQALRLGAFALLRLRTDATFPLPDPEDAAFRRAWWAALGWAAVEVGVGVTQGYEQLRLYENVMVPEDEVRSLLRSWRAAREEGAVQSALGEDTVRVWQEGVEGGVHAMPPLRRSKSAELEEAIRTVIDKDVEQLVHLKEREELEELYGIPVIRIPVFVSCLLRIDSFVLSLGLTLTLAAAYLRSPLSFPPSADPLPQIYSYTPLAVAFPIVVIIYLFLALLHTPPVLPRIGVHSTAYIGFLVGLGSVFAGLGLWGALT